MVKELDHPGFMVRDRQALLLLVTALRRALTTESYIDLLYGRWNNAEGQVQSLRNRRRREREKILSFRCSYLG